MRTQKSRSRGKPRGNNNNNNRGGINVVNRVFDSSGPEGKVRGTPQQIIDKYQQLHRDAQLSGDRVADENFQQHAENYTRMLGDAMREQEAKREAQDIQQAQQRERQNRERGEREAQRGSQPSENRTDNRDGNFEQGSFEQPTRIRNDEGMSTRSEGLDHPMEANEQPGVIDLGNGKDDTSSGLVQTVETGPKPRKPRADETKTAEQPPSDDKEAAE